MKIFTFAFAFTIAFLLINIINAENITFNVALKQRNLDILPNLVDVISDPQSNSYGDYLSIDSINNFVSPKNKNFVKNWFIKNGMLIKKDYGDALKVTSDYITLKKKLGFRKLKNGLNTYAVPSELKKYIDFIEGLSNKQYHRITMKYNEENPIVDKGYVGRESLFKLYNFNSSFSSTNSSTGVIEYSESNGFNQLGLLESEKMNGQTLNPISKEHIIGDNQEEDVESQLDVCAVSLTASDTDLWYWKTDSWLYSFAIDFMNSKQVPDVISMSWGWAEDDQCSVTTCNNQTSKEYVNRVNTEYMKLALRGISIVVASGDAGAPGRTSESCDQTRPINPVFPGSSPWVTSVGATVVTKNNLFSQSLSQTPLCKNNSCIRGHQEIPINFDLTGWTGGGGFGIFSENTPKWQKSQVFNYLNKHPNLNFSNFNSKGRGYPDVSMVGHNCPVFSDNSPNSIEPVDGTSCSSPLFAGIISLLNSHQLKNNKPKLGFVNPILYKMSQDNVFNDLTEGYNWCTEYQCCPNDGDKSNFGFKASSGWDPVSGLGTPNVEKMLAWLDKNT